MEKIVSYIKVAILLIGLLGSSPAFCKGGDEHYYDMMDVFPFGTGSMNGPVFDLYYTINSYLDEPNWVEEGLKRPSCIVNDPFFSTLTFANHRIWFHWGLSDPRYSSKSLARSFPPLLGMVKSRIPNNEDKDRFWRVIRQEEHDRLQVIYQKAAIAFGYDIGSIYDLQHEQIWAFTTILYSIHLLGDHTTTEYRIIRSEKDIREDIYQSIRTLAGLENGQKADALISFLQTKAPLSETGKGSPDGSAQKLIDALKDNKNGFSQFILSCRGYGYNYKSRFYLAGRMV